MNLKDKTVLITGASSGIGKATAIAFAKQGCSVAINFESDARSARAVLDECNHYSKGNLIVKADISRKEDVSAMLKEVKKRFHHLDILVNSAGIFDDDDSPTNLEAFEKIYRTNFWGCIAVTKFALPLMRKGKIVNVSSIHGRLGHGKPDAIAYSAFKAALDNYTKNLAKDLAPKILVNAVAPGKVLTPMWGVHSKKSQIKHGQAHLVKRMIQPEEVSDAILFLAKNDAMCGEILTIDGGMSLVTLG